ncbi:MAG: peptidyl-tRNA hydrolase Pth2 [Candidatus Bathyarchaeia archaeon]
MSEEGFQFKQSIVARVDLGMSRGKLAAQVGHAAVSASEEARKKRVGWWEGWIAEGQMKVVLKVSSLDELLELRDMASEARLPFALIQDRGLTEVPPGTITCLGIGPAPAKAVDEITGHLRLL